MLSKIPCIHQKRIKRFFKNRSAVIGLIIVLNVVFTAIFADFITYHDPYEINLASRFQPPNFKYPFGTDSLGRCVFSRTVYGARISLQAGITVVGLSLLIGVILGALSGYYKGILDFVVMRMADITLAFPGLLLAIAIVAMIGASLETVILVLGLTWWPTYARVIRSQVLSLREEEFIEAARAVGASDFHVIFRHIVPNVMANAIVIASLTMGWAILAAAALSFLGLGAPPPTPEWGRMLADARPYLRMCWHEATFPGLAIFVTVLGFNMLGDGLRDALQVKAV